jgi:hypothetical protein
MLNRDLVQIDVDRLLQDFSLTDGRTWTMETVKTWLTVWPSCSKT